MKTVYIFGNPLLSFDNLPLKLMPDLAKKFPAITFLSIDPNENLKFTDKKPVIIDTIFGIKKVAVLHDIDRIITDKIYSAHDLDLSFNLKLLAKLGYIEKVTILGVPPGIKKEEALMQLYPLIERSFSGIE
ncbi:hypothetical protein A2303_07490 [Candidatus Falkowbacteria bacterium RIFOXYB2_FULL_47_14]|uniref:Uncharacterized protein n=1 Tax=Candidatus Falkowbacteria bacterium RIFOXYA2_FULL_47_19 TaxID=1797994 RepID=A0A1F5SGG3_9BACT|nr:MAG: hypothetical protein A2227_01240 [Candidatus Falkowbacteria bacterium RIFOXYA2_FULL_47_19]OGF34989.1 MAG: hypothetical protein A2468_07195 [Candidatus Falkowbacteria bacterium RIFOXYC2_FULL_46_15]OGF43704.1 MAG: hypothetical protein A2303_07490 [Candidatus Falkowbacteria bacterium RIFOXYB2_FULL_47_14]